MGNDAQVQNEFASDLSAVARIDAVSRILEVVCRTTGMGFSAVARVTQDRWIACAVRDDVGFGLNPGGELDVRTTLCDEVRQTSHVVAIDNVSGDQFFCTHPTPKMYGFQSYISVPIRYPDGRFFGTLCALDREPALVNTPETINMFTLFADLIGFHLSAQERVTESERALSLERERAELRDQFIAVLGHDLRNPLAAVLAGAKVLGTMPLGEKAVRVAAIIQNSGTRMAGLVDNLLDFARGQLGGGLPLTPVVLTDVESTLDEVISELRTAWPGRIIERDFVLSRPVTGDRGRIAQLFSNLLANALIHGDPNEKIRVFARTDDQAEFELAVENSGPGISADMRSRLFQPFSRASETGDQQGLGLGLYIASEIARAHGGTLSVTSSEGRTRFTFRIPKRD